MTDPLKLLETIVDEKAFLTPDQRAAIRKLREFLNRDETQDTVCDWAETTFGPTTASVAFDRCAEEWDELVTAMSLCPSEVPGEAADVIITLYRVARTMGFDLVSEVRRKMAINRRRRWRVDGNGVGRHE